MRLLVAGLITLVAAGVASAQPEDRQRVPTGPGASAPADPCMDAPLASRGPQATWPGFDPRLPAPAGATSFTGVAPMGRDPSRGFPDTAQLPQQAYQAQASSDCARRLNR